MKERPILFNAEMVQAILSGRKTQTRRIMRDQPEVIPPEDECGVPGYWIPYHAAKMMVRNDMMKIACPLGMRGDQLWVRETWMPDAPRDGSWSDVEFYGCKGAPLSMIPKHFQNPTHCIHRASWTGDELVGWKPSIHMPRWASRIDLLITGVRVERLNSITNADAKAEGYPAEREIDGGSTGAWLWFRDLWDGIYPDNTFKVNPWVWVIEFKLVGGDL